MQTLQQMEHKLNSARDLHDVVRTMKSLAAVNIRQYQRTSDAIEEYFRSVEMGLQAALCSRPPLAEAREVGTALVIVFGSTQGMAGRFNESLVEFAQQSMANLSLPADRVTYWVAGARIHALVQDVFGSSERFFELPSAVEHITRRVQEMFLALAEFRRQHGELRLILLHNSPTGGASYRQTEITLLPLDRDWLAALGERPWPGRQRPFYTLNWEQLFRALIAEYLYVALFRAFAATMAAENAARLASMQRAEQNIEETIEELTRDFHTLRQKSISEELFDVISGFEALQQ